MMKDKSMSFELKAGTKENLTLGGDFTLSMERGAGSKYYIGPTIISLPTEQKKKKSCY